MADDVRPDAAVLVIGLGRFGSATAEALDTQGREVLAIDDDARTVQYWSERVTHAVQADARDLDALRQIGAGDFQVAVVATGSTIEASVLITANLVDLGVQQIWAKAISASHGTILTRIGAHHVIYPEQEAGDRTAHLLSGRMLDFIKFGADFAIVKMHAPRSLQGRSLADAQLRSRHGLVVIGVEPADGSFRYADAATVIGESDVIVVSGSTEALDRFAALPRGPALPLVE